jgi:hypothetical protein
MGRPPKPIPKKKADSLIDWIASGRTVRAWSRLKGNPCFQAVYDWKQKDLEFSRRIARAREIGEAMILDEILEIADKPKRGNVVTKNPDGTKQVKTGDMIEHRKLQIDARFKLLAKWDPAKYGDRTNQVHSGRLTLEELVCGTGSTGNDDRNTG